ncbi:MAG: F0F1 ATP synthase subunit beta, partial [Varibaculum cambriense]|nr:F0F1 ATP synthase subunit beta [Varibaculum cambriense]
MSDTERTTGVGRVSQVIGSIVDVEFPPDHLPEMYNALETMIQIEGEAAPHKLTLEVA